MMKKRLIAAFAAVVAFLAVFVANASAAQACAFWLYDPELPNSMKQ